jgi:hypothetical protein
MARFVEVIDVPVPIERAFDYMADFRNSAEWDPSVLAAEQMRGEGIGQGSAFRLAFRFLGQTLDLTYEIETYDPPHCVVLAGGNESVRSVDEITFTPREGGTRITYEARLELQGLRGLAQPLLDCVFPWFARGAVRGLRQAFESLGGGKAAKETEGLSHGAGGAA